MLTELKRSFQKRGVAATLRAVTFGAHCQLAVRGKRGLEIGGPSKFFLSAVPVYKAARSLDNCAFSAETVWEGRRENDAPFAFFPGKSGRHRVVDATELAGIEDGEYDFILSCHSLEHIANPIKALRNWRRVAPGYLVLVLPHCHETFDHLRPVTTLAHMINDFERGTAEDDQTHVREAAELSDLSRLMLPEGLTLEAAELAASDNFHNRCIHHHVFDKDNSTQLLDYCGYHVADWQITAASIFLLAKTTKLLDR
jgi:SAM-dependent methyltransferase